MKNYNRIISYKIPKMKHLYSKAGLNLAILEEQWRLMTMSMTFIWKMIMELQVIRNGIISKLKIPAGTRLIDLILLILWNRIPITTRAWNHFYTQWNKQKTWILVGIEMDLILHIIKQEGRIKIKQECSAKQWNKWKKIKRRTIIITLFHLKSNFRLILIWFILLTAIHILTQIYVNTLKEFVILKAKIELEKQFSASRLLVTMLMFL